jgi:predicted nucleic acid-binding protein
VTVDPGTGTLSRGPAAPPGGQKAAAGLLDTSIFIAGETGRVLGPLPERVAVSVVSIGELELGVLHASDPDLRARRAETLALARTADPIPISEAVMGAWARLVVDCRAAGIHRTVKLTDALIAATAVEHGLPVVTQDRDFDDMSGAHAALRVIRV